MLYENNLIHPTYIPVDESCVIYCRGRHDDHLCSKVVDIDHLYTTKNRSYRLETVSKTENTLREAPASSSRIPKFKSRTHTHIHTIKSIIVHVLVCHLVQITEFVKIISPVS